MKQDIYIDTYDMADWDLEHCSRCFVHICNSRMWHQITGELPPTLPPTAQAYTEAHLPWFDYFDEELKAMKGGKALKKLRSTTQCSKKKSRSLSKDGPVHPEHVVKLRPGRLPDQVREWMGPK